MWYLFQLQGGQCNYDGENIEYVAEGNLRVYWHGAFIESDVQDLIVAYREGRLQEWLEDYNGLRFFLALYDISAKKFFVYNDKLSSNDIMYHCGDEAITISNNAHKLFESTGCPVEIDRDAVHEMIAFFFVAAPKTIYKNVAAITVGSVLVCDLEEQEYSLEKWWYPEKILRQKNNNYESLVEVSREALLESLRDQGVEESSVALSSGVDSSGILGAVDHLRDGDPVPVVTIAPHGRDYKDFQVAQKVADFYQSPQTVIEPHVQDLLKLKDYYRNMNQPMEVPFIFGFGVVLEEAQKLGAKNMGFGFGAEAVLGNLKIARIGNIIAPIEKIFPMWFLRPLYRIVAKLKGFSKNQLEFLLCGDWVQRFFHTRGALLTREKKFFKNFNKDFVGHFRQQAEEIMKIKKLDLLDKFVLLYLHSWVIYAQTRDAISLGRQFNVDILAPFDHPKVFNELFKVPNKFRRKNGWSKQIIRDMFRPFTNEEIYKNEVGSLIIEYNEWITPNPEPFFAYLKTSPVVQDALDIEKYEREFYNLPEPGLSLVRWLGVAVWYDTNWNKDNLQNFDRIFENL
jgi:asparagine synthase (glutamine-hydrolysing)